MVGAMFVLLLAIFGYFGFQEGMKKWEQFLNDRREILKSLEAEALKGAASKTQAPMSNIQFTALLETNWLTWAKSKGIIR